MTTLFTRLFGTPTATRDRARTEIRALLGRAAGPALLNEADVRRRVVELLHPSQWSMTDIESLCAEIAPPPVAVQRQPIVWNLRGLRPGLASPTRPAPSNGATAIFYISDLLGDFIIGPCWSTDQFVRAGDDQSAAEYRELTAVIDAAAGRTEDTLERRQKAVEKFGIPLIERNLVGAIINRTGEQLSQRKTLESLLAAFAVARSLVERGMRESEKIEHALKSLRVPAPSSLRAPSNYIVAGNFIIN